MLKDNVDEMTELEKHPFCYISFKKALKRLEALTIYYKGAETQYDTNMAKFVIGASTKLDACVCQELQNMAHIMRKVTMVQVNITSWIVNSVETNIENLPQIHIDEQPFGMFEILGLLDKWYKMLKARCNRVFDRDFLAKNSPLYRWVDVPLQEEMKSIIRSKCIFEHVCINIQSRICFSSFDKTYIKPGKFYWHMTGHAANDSVTW
jgi:hypothetical protein